jgi:uncharacterized protein
MSNQAVFYITHLGDFLERMSMQPPPTTTGEAQLLAQIYDETQQLFSGYDDPAHGWEHIGRVYNLALTIARQEQADAFVVGVAALLHDLGRLSHDETLHHADLSVQSAAELLARYEVAPSKQEAILHAIDAHSYSRGIEPATLEAGIVRDADRLDSLGAIGILRWAITGTIKRTPQTRSYDPRDPFAEQRAPDDRHYMLDHFYSKLLKLSNGMFTATGRKLAERRTAFMRAYLDEFRSELEIEPELNG